MTLEAFRDAVRRRIEERANTAINLMGQVRWRPPHVASPVSKSGKEAPPVALPSMTAEDIAFAHTIHQAEAYVLTEALRFVDEEYRKAMGQPAEPNDPEKSAAIESQTKERKKGMY